MRKYIVLCEDGGKNFDVAMFKIYEKEKKQSKVSFRYHHKLNRNDYMEFLERNKNNKIHLYIDNPMITSPLEDVDERARALKYSSVLRDTLEEVKDWLKMLEHLEIIGLRDVLFRVSSVLSGNKARKDINNK